MVTFVLKEENEKYFIYLYYPEGDTSSEPGIIAIDKETGGTYITRLAKRDFDRDISSEEINNLIRDINEMRVERGEPLLEKQVTEGAHSAYYGHKAIREIQMRLNQGEVPKEGRLIWY